MPFHHFMVGGIKMHSKLSFEQVNCRFYDREFSHTVTSKWGPSYLPPTVTIFNPVTPIQMHLNGNNWIKNCHLGWHLNVNNYYKNCHLGR